MSIDLHIERLVLDGLPFEPAQAGLLRAALENELGRLLREGGLVPRADLGAAMLRAAPVTLAAGASAAALGRQIAASVYGAVGGQP
ncbi:MAG: hypothetical protein V4754_13675 [Pseudomonadota bacterium]